MQGLDGLADMLGGMAQGGMLDMIWDMPMVTSIAFHPRPAQPTHLGATSGARRDGTFAVPGGDRVSYRLYAPEEPAKVVVFVFHGNAEVCTDMDDVAQDVFHRCGAAVLSIDYRGFAWGTGQPSLKKLCGDAERCFAQSRKVLEAAGITTTRCVMMGRSIGATCAVHLASRYAKRVYGLVVDSGLMSIKQLPMVAMMAPQLLGPQGPQMLAALKEPFDTVGKLSAVSCPTLVMHGSQDEIVPVAQGMTCHERCASQQKKMKIWEGAGHNNVGVMFAAQWAAEIAELLAQAEAFENPFPAGALVEAHSLSVEALNGLRGRVLGPQKDRVRVDLGEPNGEKALKPTNLTLIEEEEPPEEEDPETSATCPFPSGTLVEAHSLKTATMNGLRGRVIGPQKERVLVAFDEPHGEKALKSENLRTVDGEGAA